jgi:hypothetical protein
MASDLSKKLRAQGWVEQFTASGHRLEEAVENYKSIGFEVKTVPVKNLDLDGCIECFDDPNDQTMMIFTRKID